MKSLGKCKNNFGLVEAKTIICFAICLIFIILFVLSLDFVFVKTEEHDPDFSIDQSNCILYEPGIENEVLRIVAAHDSSAYSKSLAFLVCDGVDDQIEINEAFAVLPNEGGVVVLSEGTFSCSGEIIPTSNSSLRGQGEETRILFNSNNSHLRIEREYVILEDFYISGERYSDRDIGVVLIRVGHVVIKNITGHCDSSTQGVFFIYSFGEPLGYNKNIEDIEFIDCKVTDAGTFGWIFSANSNSAYRTIKNVRMTDCQAINCGRDSRYDPWVTGFDLAERCDIDGMIIQGCLAEGSWESGFHFEFLPKKRNIRIVDCVSRNNSQKMFSGAEEPTYGAGFVVNGDAYLENCTSEKNSVGYFCSNGGIVMKGCSDHNSQNAIKILDVSDGLKVDSCKIVGSPYPVIISGSNSHSVLIDNTSIISDEKVPSINAAIQIKKTVNNASKITIRNSVIRGYLIGVDNQASDGVKVSNVSVSGLRIDHIN